MTRRLRSLPHSSAPFGPPPPRSARPARWRAVLLGFLLPALAPAGVTKFDLIVRGGTVIDGTGTPGRTADLAVTDDRIAVVGALPAAATATRVIDATGLLVVPGFIDGHTHSGPGLALPERAAARNHLAQGVTTVFINPDGGGPADLAAQRAALARAQPGVNVAPLIGHNAVRIAVLGHATRAPDAGELAQMQALVRQALADGAFGLSSGPFYAPGSFSDTAELVALATVAAEFGGFHTSHIRDEGDYSIGVVAAVEELIEVSRRARLTGIVTHIKTLGPASWGLSAELIRRIDAARLEGVPVFADQYPYEASATSLAAALVPRWAQEGGEAALQRRLSDPEPLARIRQEMSANLIRRGGAGAIQIRACRSHPEHEGRRLDAIAQDSGSEPVELAITLLRLGSVDIVSFSLHEDDIAAFMRQPWTMTASDGDLPEFGATSAHPRSYGTFPRKLRRYAMELGVVSLERAVHSMTGQPAAVLGVRDRGVLRPGAFADLVVLDPRAIRDPSTYEHPHAYAEGAVWVVVNGAVAFAHGAPTPVRAGRLLRRD